MNAKVQCCLLRHARQQSRIWESYPWLMYSRGYEKDALLTLKQVMNCGMGPSCSKGGYGSLLGSSPFMVSEVSRSRKNARGAEERRTFPGPRSRVSFRVLLSRDFSGLPQMESMLTGYGYRYPLDNSLSSGYVIRWIVIFPVHSAIQGSTTGAGEKRI